MTGNWIEMQIMARERQLRPLREAEDGRRRAGTPARPPRVPRAAAPRLRVRARRLLCRLGMTMQKECAD